MGQDQRLVRSEAALERDGSGVASDARRLELTRGADGAPFDARRAELVALPARIRERRYPASPISGGAGSGAVFSHSKSNMSSRASLFASRAVSADKPKTSSMKRVIDVCS